ncbi:MAG: acetylglutamate kinase [Lentisphaerae bacterium GWF2_45_14]|nr:MAG: acetylglutamate kinase [Lentisphaerae bacterium GWF2_45_14]
MENLISKAATLQEALPYIQRFRGSIVVVKFGGSAMEDPELIKMTARDIVLMECIGMKPVIVHGGGKAITARMKELNIETRFVNGMRVTCEKTIEVVDDVLHNVINKHLVECIHESGGKAQSISGKDTIKAVKMLSKDPGTGEEIDLGAVGDITSVDPQLILEAIQSDSVPVITPLGRGKDGQIFNINADIAACKVAEALRARKLVFLSDVPGILRDKDDESSIIPTIKVSEVQGLIDSKIINGGMLPKIKSCLHALEVGSNKVHMIDGRITHSLLLEIFTDEGIGTEIIKA